jgi:cytochrome c-type biogenesis protein CcmE
VVSTLKKNRQEEVIGVESSPDRLSFKFIMLDENQEEQEVLYPNPMPTDFLRSEQVVVIGSYHQDKFVADKILLKCPSKYQEEEIQVSSL